jgi:3D (Asp-Asp-Asp) domain-containing protein
MSDQLDLDTQNLLKAGSPGLSVSRVRIRTEDGVETGRTSDPETIITQPVARVIGYGTRVVQHTTQVDGQTITYWRALQFWATSYHPAETGSNITASGQKVAKGLVSVDYHYIPFGTQMYVPGYGYAVSADTGGFTGRWIDLGYLDADYVPWHQWLTVYFLWPPPAVIAYTIPPPITFKGYSPPGP